MICPNCNGEGIVYEYGEESPSGIIADDVCLNCGGLGVINLIYVFGSNEAGIHGKGAALTARLEHAAILGQGFGRQGQSFGIPTKGKINLGGTWGIGRPLPLSDINNYVGMFVEYAKQVPQEHFKITQIGTGHAGFKHEQMAPMFADSPGNCLFDEAWRPWLGNRWYWGTYVPGR
jgi:hypothetical protein